MENFNYAELSNDLLKMALDWAPTLLLVIVTLIIGFWVIKVIIKTLRKGMEKSSVEISLQKFLISLSNILLKVLLFVSIASMIGIKTASFVAILGAAGLAVGLALQGSLANFAGGVLILLFKPFKVGDFIDGSGHSGTVNSISVFNTVLKTPDNKTVIIPNGNLSNSNITNFSTEPRRRVDMTFGIGYEDDIKKAKDILNGMVSRDQRILTDPEPVVVISELADSSVNFAVRAWCNAADYWGIYFDMHEQVKLEFDKNKISIPYPQQDIHLYKH